MTRFDVEGVFERSHNVGQDGALTSFEDTLLLLKSRLDELYEKVSQRELSEVDLNREVRSIIEWADLARVACHFYLDFGHPVWIQASRLREFDPTVIADRKSAFLDVVQRSHSRLVFEYDRLRQELV